MNRRVAAALAVALLAACTETAEDQDASQNGDTVPRAPAGAQRLSLADLEGTWRVQVMPTDRDTVLNTHTLWASADTSAWKMLFDGRTDTIKVRVLGIEGDSVRTSFGPYSSALRPDVKVVTEAVHRLQGGNLVGDIIAHYQVSTPDSVLRLRSTAARAR